MKGLMKMTKILQEIIESNNCTGQNKKKKMTIVQNRKNDNKNI